MKGFKIDSTRQQLVGDQDQPGHLGHPAEGVDHQHAVERPQRVLGLRVRDAGGGGRAAIARSGDQAGAGQPDARRGRHDGPDRRRAGAVRAGDPAPGAGDRRVGAAHHRTGAEASHRQRHRRSELGRGDRSRPIGPTSVPRRSTSPAAIRRALSERTDIEIAKKNTRNQRRHPEIPGGPDAAAGRSGRVLRLQRPGRHAADHDRHGRRTAR